MASLHAVVNSATQGAMSLPSTISRHRRGPSTSEIFNVHTSSCLRGRARIGPNVRAGKVEISPQELVCVHAVLKGLGRRSRVLPTVDAKLFHPGQQSRAIRAQASGGSVRAAHAPLRFGECVHYRVALLSRISVSNAGFITPRICLFSSDLPGFMQVSRRGRVCLRFLEFCEWSLKRPTPCENHRAFN